MPTLRIDTARRRTPPEAPALSDRAFDNLRYIRETMERAGAFTAVSGSGLVMAGVVALVAGAVASQQPSLRSWAATWIAAALLAIAAVALSSVRKARALGVPLVSGPGRKFALAVAPPLLAGALLTPVLVDVGRADLVAGAWLLLYGAGVVAGGALSVRIVPFFGGCVMALGAAALLAPAGAANWFMLAGFGVLHVAFGWTIARRHGG
jgi:hypothetical protein